MARNTANLAIVFADISGSTRLYETLGDAIARELVSQCLELMTVQITRFDGTVIKTIGDEIMCTFPTAERATESSMGMQEAITEDLPDINPNMPSTMTIRIGLHFGSVILEGGDVFGDAVNVAARMAGLAKGWANHHDPTDGRRVCRRFCAPKLGIWIRFRSRGRPT